MSDWVPQLVEDIDGAETLIDVTDEGVIQIIPATVDLYLGRDQRDEFGRGWVMACHEAERREAAHDG